MIYSTSLFNKSFETNENEIPVLIIENQKFSRDLIISLLNEGDECEHKFYLDDRELDIKKDIELIIDIFNINLNQSKNITKLYNYIKSEYINEENYIETQNLILKIREYMQTILFNIDYELEYDENIEITNILKVVDLKFSTSNTTIIENIIDYINVSKNFFNKKLFIFINLKSILTNDEQEELYKFVSYNKINIMLIESSMPRLKNEIEIYRIIDEDLCVIY